MGITKRLNILVIDDSAVVRQALTQILSRNGMDVIIASDPIIAMDKIKHTRPDIIMLDIEMPRMDGITFLKKIMAEAPLPVIICSGYAAKGTEIALRALEEGAVEIITKPKLGIQGFLHESALALIDLIHEVAKAKIRNTANSIPTPSPENSLNNRPPLLKTLKDKGLQPVSASKPEPKPEKLAAKINTDHIVAIGASTGGPEAIRLLLEAMPPDAPGIVIVQHMPELFTRAFADRLNKICRIEIKEAENNDPILKGRALIAPGDHHMVVVKNGSFYKVEIGKGPPVSRHRPSVDVLFRSVARSAGPKALGIILTGMGSDGADGLLEMRQAGAVTIAQDERSSVVFGMPKEAIARGAVDEIAPLTFIPTLLLKLMNH